MSWVPFHSSLREGDKRGLPRAVRFIYLELALLTRSHGGRLPLPRGFRTDLDAVHDILGGNRRELALALELLTTPLDPTDPSDEPMLRLSGPPERRILELPAFSRWVRADNSAERVRRFRNRQREQLRAFTDTCNGTSTVAVTHDPVTGVTTPFNKKKIREEKRKQKEMSVAANAAPSGSDEPSGSPVVRPATIPLPVESGSVPAKPPEPDVVAVYEHWVSCWKRVIRGTRPPALNDKRRGKIRARLREGFTVSDLKLAVDGVWASQWNVDNHHYDIELVCRDDAHVHRYMAKAREAFPAANRFGPLPPLESDDDIPMAPDPEDPAADLLRAMDKPVLRLSSAGGGE